MEKEKLLDIQNLRVEYRMHDRTVQAVNDVSLEVRKGETLGLVGETGAGKTTIALSILRILPEPPAKIAGGSIYYEGKDILELSEAEMRKVRGNKISMIFQDPMTALNPVDTVGDQILEGIQLHEKISKKDAYIKACEMREMVGIPAERYHDYPHQFSGGMKQRIIIAMALVCRPELLLADEPTTALDVTIQAQVLEMVTRIREELGTSMLLITHDLGVIADMCDRVCVIYAGQIVESGTTEQIFNNTSHPYTVGLFGAIPTLDMKQNRLVPIDGLMPDPADLPRGCHFCPRCKKKKPICETQVPELTEIGDGHLVRCHLFAGEGGE
ncbi:MAG: ABC transporter ATP-binding protein [Lachnospiraceae bacterium]|nr:ABC transporter ATP-binding protein [Lachnospiraceae bacterium]